MGGWLPQDSCDLLLSGHSHGGQVGLNMFGLRPTLWGMLGHRDQGWWEAGGAPHYVHAGNWWIGLPPRMGVCGEIAVFDVAERRELLRALTRRGLCEDHTGAGNLHIGRE